MLRLANSSDNDKLNILFREASLRPEYQYYFSEGGTYRFEIADNTVYRRDFISFDESNPNKIIGFISYQISPDAKRAHSFGLISFEFGNLHFMTDLMKVIVDSFETYGLNSITWNVFIDNPAYRGYKKLCSRLGGREVGVCHQVARLLDGKLHDDAIFEIMKSDYFNSKFYKSGKSRIVKEMR